MNAAGQVWALVSGLPRGEREHRRLMVLQAYIDDSGSEPQSPVFVLAGFIATYAEWASFSDAWKTALNLDPSLDYFKMAEAKAWEGQFERARGWNETLRRQRIDLLATIITSHARLAVHVSIRNDDFGRLIKSIPLPVRRLATDSPYSILLHKLIMFVAGFMGITNSQEKCDFIFDIQKGFSEEILSWWSISMQTMSRTPRIDIARYITSSPMFKAFLVNVGSLSYDRTHAAASHFSCDRWNACRVLPPRRSFGSVVNYRKIMAFLSRYK